MAQADQTIQNATFPTVRADINNNLAALFSDNSGNAAPTVTVAYQDWIDTSGTNPIWKKRNAANNAWITLGTIIGSTIAFEGASTLPSQTGNSGKFLTTNGTAASWGAITATGQLLRAPQILTSGTSYATPANCIAIYVEAVGGGGGGDGNPANGSGGGGGAGGYCAKYFTVTALTSYTYAIGAGGTAGTNVSNGGAGGTTTFTVGGTTITAGGGGGGATSGGAGGTCTNGDMNINGGGGAPSGTTDGGMGGNSFFGGGGRGGINIAGTAGAAGGGGSGSSGSTARSGGVGGAGLIRIWEFS